MSNCEQEHIRTELCPLCGGSNACAVASGMEPSGCWCMKQVFPEELLTLVPQAQRNKACICEACLRKFQLSDNER